MKVCTDACVLGATAPLATAKRILDIGTGTGLLALMAAQRAPEAFIEAVELDTLAANQAAANAAASPWASRLRIHALSLQQYVATAPGLFDHIICNPPFFRHSLQSPDAARTTARHTSPDTLPFSTLCASAAGLLTPSGQLTILLPPPEMHHLEREAAGAGLYPSHRITLHHRPGSKVLRHITTFGQSAGLVATQALAIHQNTDEGYSAEFRVLLRDFYLAF
jgi:tRNA1Val (adenine37-N6)-methyltransferase